MSSSRGVGLSDTGLRGKQHEDTLLVDDELGLYVVCDGMGGHAAGEVASALAVSTVQEAVRAEVALCNSVALGDTPATELVALAERAVRRAADAVHRRATGDAAHAGMGCTLTMLLVAGPVGVMAHVGDSRLYLVRMGGGCDQLSTDHTMAEELIRAGVLTREAARESRYNHVLSRVIGNQPAVQVDTLQISLVPGDRFVLCTDGFSNYLPSPQWLGDECTGSLGNVPVLLVAHANAEGGADNISVVVVEILPAEAIETADTVRRRADVAALDGTPLFAGLALKDRIRLRNVARLRELEADEMLIEAGDEVSALHVCVSGGLLIAADPDSTEVAVGPGRALGLHTLFNTRPARANVRASRPSRVLVLDRDRLMPLCYRRPRLGLVLLERLAETISRNEDII